MSLLFNIYTFILILLVITIVFGWLMFNKSNCDIPLPCPPCPRCPECPIVKFPSGLSLEGCIKNTKEAEYMREMIRYLTYIIKRYEAEKELYILSHGYAQVYNSPKMEYIKKELRRMLQSVKKDPEKIRFFEKHLNGVIG